MMKRFAKFMYEGGVWLIPLLFGIAGGIIVLKAQGSVAESVSGEPIPHPFLAAMGWGIAVICGLGGLGLLTLLRSEGVLRHYRDNARGSRGIIRYPQMIRELADKLAVGGYLTALGGLIIAACISPLSGFFFMGPGVCSLILGFVIQGFDGMDSLANRLRDSFYYELRQLENERVGYVLKSVRSD